MYSYSDREFIYDEFLRGEFLVHCPTREEATAFFEFLDDKGWTWKATTSKKFKDETRWAEYKEETVYTSFAYKDKTNVDTHPLFGSYTFHIDKQDEIIPFSWNIINSQNRINVSFDEILALF